jgi:Na+-transporting NADH:ubiquinone oxidoreductase subunit NqrA
MAMQIVMDHTGDTRHCFNPYDVQALANAEKRFIELTKAGFIAAVRTAPGEVSKVQSFDPTAEETLFLPRLVGG